MGMVFKSIELNLWQRLLLRIKYGPNCQFGEIIFLQKNKTPEAKRKKKIRKRERAARKKNKA